MWVGSGYTSQAGRAFDVASCNFIVKNGAKTYNIRDKTASNQPDNTRVVAVFLVDNYL